MKNFSHLITILFLTLTVLLFAGCAGQKAAQGTARILVGQTTRLNSEINAAIKVEETNYNSATLILGRSADREIPLVQDEAVIRAGQDFARAVTQLDTVTDADIRDFFENAARDTWATRRDALAKADADTKAFIARLQKLQAKGDELDGVRKVLESLQKESSVETQGQELYDWSKKLVDGVKKK